MDLKRAIAIQNKSVDALRSIYRTARTCGYNQDWIHREETQIFGRLPKNFSMMRREHLRMACKVLWEEMFERDIESVYLFKGKTYSTHKDSKHHAPTKLVNPALLHKKNEGFAFFWIETGRMYSSNWHKDGQYKGE